jgi:hypothetical protein
LSLFINGQRSAIAVEPLDAGPTVVRALIPGNGTMSLAVPGVCEIVDAAPFPGGFPVQLGVGLQAGESFGPLKAKVFPNSTPFDGNVQQLLISVLPP